MRLVAGYTGDRVRRGGVLEVRPDGVDFQPHRGERLLWARRHWIPAHDITAVDVRPPRLRLPGTPGVRRLQITTGDQVVHLFSVGHPDQVAERVRAILAAGPVDEDDERRFEQELRRTSSSGFLRVGLAVALFLLLCNLVPAFIDDRRPGAADLVAAGMAVLLALIVLGTYLWDRRQESRWTDSP